jgi:hypothetical protein
MIARKVVISMMPFPQERSLAGSSSGRSPVLGRAEDGAVDAHEEDAGHRQPEAAREKRREHEEHHRDLEDLDADRHRPLAEPIRELSARHGEEDERHREEDAEERDDAVALGGGRRGRQSDERHESLERVMLKALGTA